MDSSSRLRILLLGYIVRRPLGGGAWPFLQYAMGLQRLGHDVYFLEDSEDYPACYDPTRHVTDEDATFGLTFADRVLSGHGFADRWAYYDAHSDRWAGPCSDRILDLCASADVVINVSGVNPIRPWLQPVPRRVYVDTDPAFQQVRCLTDPDRRARTLAHNVFFTYGENIASGDASLPDDGIPWRPCRPPVILDAWPVTPGPPDGPFTTVMLWDSYPSRDHGDVHLGMKSESFEPYWDLPRSVTGTLELAVGGPDVPRERLRSHAWSVVNPLEPTKDLTSYQRYIQASAAEFTVAKHGYVVSACGWFSERSANYLASGRPVVTQDTGFQSWLPTGEGVLSFSDPAEAVAAIDSVRGNYTKHCRAAREIAEESFDSDRVLRSLVDRIGSDLPDGMPT